MVIKSTGMTPEQIAILDQLFKLLVDFEKRNNISAVLMIVSDKSCSVNEFWSEECIKSCDSMEELSQFLERGILEKDDISGRAVKPIKILSE